MKSAYLLSLTLALLVLPALLSAQGTAVEVCYDLPEGGDDAKRYICQCCPDATCCTCGSTQFYGPGFAPAPTSDSCTAFCQANCVPATDGWENQCTLFNDCTAIIKAYEDAQESGARGVSPDCVPGDSLVNLLDGSTKPVEHLALGDMIQSGANSFSPVVAFSHKDATALSTRYLTATTASGATVTASLGHYVPLASGRHVAMRKLAVDDLLLLADGTPDAVVAVSAAQRRGAFNPQTAAGAMVVDGVLVSCYTEAVHPGVAHALMMPIRLVGWATGYKVDPLMGLLDSTGWFARTFAFVVPGAESY